MQVGGVVRLDDALAVHRPELVPTSQRLECGLAQGFPLIRNQILREHHCVLVRPVALHHVDEADELIPALRRDKARRVGIRHGFRFVVAHQEAVGVGRITAHAHQIMAQEHDRFLELLVRRQRHRALDEFRSVGRRAGRGLGGDDAIVVCRFAVASPVLVDFRLLGETIHRVKGAVQRIIGEHARIVPLRERQAARQQLHHLRRVQLEILVAGHPRDQSQRLLPVLRVGVARHGIHVHAHVLDELLEIVEALAVPVRRVAHESRGHLDRLRQIRGGVDPARAHQRVADHGIHSRQRLRIDAERGHVVARHGHAVLGAFGGRHGG